MLFDSVAPLVKMISLGSALISLATFCAIRPVQGSAMSARAQAWAWGDGARRDVQRALPRRPSRSPSRRRVCASAGCRKRRSCTGAWRPAREGPVVASWWWCGCCVISGPRRRGARWRWYVAPHAYRRRRRLHVQVQRPARDARRCLRNDRRCLEPKQVCVPHRPRNGSGRESEREREQQRENEGGG